MKKNLSKNLAVTMRIILQDDEGGADLPGRRSERTTVRSPATSRTLRRVMQIEPCQSFARIGICKI
jgi:hypothetical protein